MDLEQIKYIVTWTCCTSMYRLNVRSKAVIRKRSDRLGYEDS